MNRAGGSPLRLLMVEDNPGDVRLVREMLAEGRPGACVVDHVERLSDAVGRLDGEPVDVVLLDLSLPDAQGLDALAQVHAADPKVPIVVLSGHCDEDLAVQAVQSGAQDYLVKGQGTGDLLHRAIRYAIERKRLEERLENLARYDDLTGLANRRYFHERLEEAIEMAQRLNRFVALMFMDLDRFKQVNDTYGHPAGDALLKEVAGQLEATVRQTDTVTRLGGDEFAIILVNLESETTVNTLATRIIERLSQPVTVDGCLVKSGTSIGISLYPYDAADPDELIRKADHALYQAKAEGRGAYHMYDEAMQAGARARMVIENDMRLALVREEFVLYYQPQVSIPDRRIVGAEALVRWRHPARGLVPPGEFVPVAESSGLIVEMGEWVLRESCARNKAWQDAGLPPIRVAVNISARQFQSENLIPAVELALEESGMDSEWLELEITESVVLADADRVAEKLRLLNDMGVRLALDDFGTGYSSLAYLKRFPVQRLKIDQSFVRNLTMDADDAAITKAVIQLGHSLHLDVIAEGVETEEQLAFLRRQHCREIQGFLIGRPMAADDFFAWFMDQPERVLASAS